MDELRSRRDGYALVNFGSLLTFQARFLNVNNSICRFSRRSWIAPRPAESAKLGLGKIPPGTRIDAPPARGEVR